MIKLAPPVIIKVDTIEEFTNVIIEKSFPYGLIESGKNKFIHMVLGAIMNM